MQDQEIKCQGVDKKTPCPHDATFIFTERDQEFYKERGFEPPKRCADCRDEKKRIKEANGGEAMYQKRDRRPAHAGRRDREEN